MKGNFRSLLRKFCLESTILGLKYFYLYPDRLSRCFWCVNMVAVLFLACVLTQRLHGRFAAMPTQITIENQYEPISNLPYPAITLCSPIQITKSFTTKLNERLINIAPDINLEATLPVIIGFYNNANINESATLSLQAILNHENISISELMGSVAQSCSSFLKLCFFETKRYENCDTLFLPVLTAHGLCCTFNSKYFYNGKTNEYAHNAVTRTVRIPGETRGLIVVADYDPEDVVRRTILYGGAIKLMFTDSLEFPNNQETTLIETKTESFHTLNAEYTTCSDEVMTLAPHDRKCYVDGETTLPYFDIYSKSNCELTCVLEAMQKECECLLHFVPHSTSQSRQICNITSIPCILKTKYYSRSVYSCVCLADCEERKYSADIILGNFDAIPYMLQPSYADLKLNQTTVIMNFLFINSMYVKKKQETVMSLSILISNLGGIFGLCLGCSFLSLLEIIFYVYMVIRNHFRSRRQGNLVQYIE